MKSARLIIGLAFAAPSLKAQTVYNVGDAASLATAMGSVGNGDTINLTGNITLTSSLPLLQATGVTINGNGHTLDGAGAYSGFFIYTGSSAINNLTIAHTTATGGSAVGGGGLGAGGAIFVNSGATVVLTNMTFSSNQAVGGTSVGSGSGSGGGILNFPAGAAGTDDPGSGATAGTGGSGGFGGGGGGGGYASGGYGGRGGTGGFGGGGGKGGNGIAGGPGGAGGYGGGGGGGGQGTTSTYGAGAAGFGGGVGGGAAGGFYTNAFGGGGGAGLGGAIFVMQGASITFSGNITQTGGAVAGGNGIFGGDNGQGAGTAVFLQGTGTLAFAPGAGSTQTIGDVISDEVGSGLSGNGGTNGQWGLSKAGAGTLVLNGANQFTGPTTITGGSLVLGNVAALQNSTLISTTGTATGLSFGTLAAATLGGLAGSDNLALTNTATAAVTLTVGQNNADTTYSGALSGAGSLVKSGSGTLTLTGLNAQTGGTTLNSGTLTVAAGATLGGSTGALVVNAGTLNLNAPQTVSSLSGSGGTINFTSPLTVNDTGTDLFAGTITGTNLTKTGAGSLTLSGLSSLSGAVAVQNGVLSFATTPGAGVTTVTLGNGTTGGDLLLTDVQASTFSPGQILVAGTGTNRLAMGGALTVTSPISATTAGAKLTIDRVGPNNNATISFNGNITDGAGTLGLVVANGQVTLNGSANSFSGGLTVNDGSIAATSNLTVSSLNGAGGAVGIVGGKVFTVNNTGSDTYAGSIFDGYDGSNLADRGQFAKSGPGTLTLTGGSGAYFSGGTTISGGTLRANNASGSALGFGPVLVQSGATLGGTGFIGGVSPFGGLAPPGVTTIAAGAHLSPGAAAAPGTLTFGSGLTLSDGALLDFRLGAASDGVLVTGGTLTGPASAAGATFGFSAASGFAAGTYTLIDGTGATLSGFDLNDFALGSGIAGYNFVFGLTGNVLTVTATAIPEPATCAAIFGLLALGLAAWRARRS